MSGSNNTSSTTGSSTYAYRHYYAKLDFEARAPPASALPLPKWYRQSSSPSASASSGIETGHSRDDDKSAQDVAEGDTERPDRESEVKCTPATSSVMKEGADDSPLEIRKRHRAEVRETQQACFQQWAEHQIDTALKSQTSGEREAIASPDHVRDLALRQAQKLSALWVRNQMMGQRLAAKLRRDTVKLAQREAMEITKGEDEGYRSAS